MTRPARQWSIIIEYKAEAYWLAVTVATITCFSAIMMRNGLVVLDSPNIFLFLGVGWLFCFWAAYIPYQLGIIIAKRFDIFHWVFFVGGSTFTAAAIGLIFFTLPRWLFNVRPDISYLDWLPIYLPSGLIAGLVGWGYLSWRVRRQNSSAVNAELPQAFP